MNAQLGITTDAIVITFAMLFLGETFARIESQLSAAVFGKCEADWRKELPIIEIDNGEL